MGIYRFNVECKVIHPKYYKHLCSAQPFGQIKNGPVSGRLSSLYIKKHLTKIKTVTENWVIQGVILISGLRFKLTFIVFILMVLKQTMPQKKALIYSFKMTP